MSEITIHIDKDWRKVGTVQGVAKEIIKMDSNAEDYEFRLQAMLKRLIHHQKHSVYSRLRHHVKDAPEGIMYDIIDIQVETHANMSELPDEEIITWDVGPHKYKQGK